MGGGNARRAAETRSRGSPQAAPLMPRLRDDVIRRPRDYLSNIGIQMPFSRATRLDFS